MAKSGKIGKQWEQAALSYLTEQGLRCVARNYRCRCGELDLIMLDDAVLVAIEVRYRKHSHFGTALDSVDFVKRAKLIRAMQSFLQHHPQYEEHPVRFDVIAIGPSEWRWVRGAFDAQ